jgi:hypothetical protein
MFVVHLADQDGSTTHAAAVVMVADAALLSFGSPNSFTIAKGTSTGEIAVASFTDADPGATVADFLAIINWGDGQTSLGNVTQTSQGFAVISSHTYLKLGTFQIKVRIIDDHGGASVLLTRSTINVQ